MRLPPARHHPSHRQPVSRLMATLALLLLLALGAGCSPQAAEPVPAGPRPERGEKIRIGLSLDTLKEERWQRDRDIFVARARELGAVVIAQAAASDDALQIAQAENMVDQGVDILVVVPHNAEAAGLIVEIAHASGVKVISYDRMINGADVDYYISFDNQRVGELQAEYMVRHVPRGNYALIGGAYTDNNARLLREGQLKVLNPLVKNGQIRIVYDEFTPEWQPAAARAHAEQALDRTAGQIDAFLVANDGTAGGVISALEARGLAGQIPVTGQDAELAAIHRIVAGTQTLTVYKPIKLLAEQAAEVAVAMALGQSPPVNNTVHNGYKDVPAYLLEPLLVDASNILETVVEDGFHSYEAIYGDQPGS